MGSLALGSFILAIVWVVKVILAYIAAKIMQIDLNGASKVLLIAVKCMMCFVHCFERFIKFLNKNAYIQIALNGSTFCTAAREAFFLILRNAGRFVTLGGIGHIFQFLGKWSITTAATFAGYVLITRSEDIKDEIHSPIFPTIVFVFVSYLISALVMSVYSMACDSIMHCFLADEELMAKDNRLPAHAPEPILNFMNREKDADNKSGGCCSC
mmetsp:Transcript_30027/g.5423  ORF Transcript_30027/g.5423 Transcript_30027/m.5423 type:complete len:212 (-) Transcript_30027:38-673(-)